MKKISVLGGGSWGTALSMILSSKDLDIIIWVRDKKLENQINSGENKKYLPDIKLPSNIKATTDIKKALENTDIILQAIPTNGVREVFNMAKDYIKPHQIIINVSKGIEENTLLRISEILNEIVPENTYVVLSGPSHAEEVGLFLPTTVIVSSEDKEAKYLVQDLFMTENFRVYTNSDVLGVELGGALKNVIALATGISDGLGYGDNSKAALINRGIFEMASLGEAMGAKRNTFFGLSGIGDLIVTCTSLHSRNRKAGLLIGEGYNLKQAINKVGMVVEGVRTTNSAYDLCKKYDMELPITEQLYEVLQNNKDPREAVNDLMMRERKSEMEGWH